MADRRPQGKSGDRTEARSVYLDRRTYSLRSLPGHEPSAWLRALGARWVRRAVMSGLDPYDEHFPVLIVPVTGDAQNSSICDRCRTGMDRPHLLGYAPAPRLKLSVLLCDACFDAEGVPLG